MRPTVRVTLSVLPGGGKLGRKTHPVGMGGGQAELLRSSCSLTFGFGTLLIVLSNRVPINSLFPKLLLSRVLS